VTLCTCRQLKNEIIHDMQNYSCIRDAMCTLLYSMLYIFISLNLERTLSDAFIGMLCKFVLLFRE
jgi:hypothetical protein